MLNSRLPDRNPNYFIGSGSKLFSRIQIQIILGSKLLSKIKIQLFSRIRIKKFFSSVRTKSKSKLWSGSEAKRLRTPVLLNTVFLLDVACEKI